MRQGKLNTKNSTQELNTRKNTKPNFIHYLNSFAITIDSNLTTIDEVQDSKNERGNPIEIRLGNCTTSTELRLRYTTGTAENISNPNALRQFKRTPA